MPRRIVIVSRTRPNFVETASRMFSGESNVQVVLDRRRGSRRRDDRGLQIHDKRRRDRRNRPQVDSQVRTIGFAVVQVD